MKIYVSEKDKEQRKLDDFEILEELGCVYFKSLEQHDKEIRKQVLQELKEDYGGIDYGITSKKYKLTNFDCDITKPLKQIIREKIKDARKPLKDEIELLKNDIVNYKADIENLKDQSFGIGRIKYLEKELEVYKMALDLASQTILEMLGKPIVTGGVITSKLAFTPKDTEYFLEQARKEFIK